MVTQIHAKILNLIGKETFVMNVGKNKGITKNMRFEVLAPASDISVQSYVKGRLKVVEVYEKFSLAEIYEFSKKIGKDESKINVGDDLLQIPQEPHTQSA
jgi:hypothetical protein